jgi:hypothetical protein
MYSTRQRAILRTGGGIILVLLIIGYAAFQARGVALGPSIILDSDPNGSQTAEAVIGITGKILRANAISLNDRPIFVDLEGRFSERLALMEGYNILVIKARGADGKEEVRTIEVFRTSPSGTSTQEIIP